jgi:hypothetical protein
LRLIRFAVALALPSKVALYGMIIPKGLGCMMCARLTLVLLRGCGRRGMKAMMWLSLHYGLIKRPPDLVLHLSIRER